MSSPEYEIDTPATRAALLVAFVAAVANGVGLTFWILLWIW